MDNPNSGKKIIIAPLDWGLGHATRCIPIIRYCMQKGHRVTIVSTGRSLELLKKEFPSLEFTDLPGYSIYYQKSGSFIIKIILQLRKIFRGIKREHAALKKIVNTIHPDVIISDSRYGLWNDKIKSVLISHQMMVKIPAMKFAEYFVHKWLLSHHNKFNEVWIPDVSGNMNLSGDLSHHYKLQPNTKFIGILTRFSTVPVTLPIKYDALVIISGPEPQRTIFEEMIIKQAQLTALKLVIIKGKSEESSDAYISENVRVISHLPAEELFQFVLESAVIISRGGYSTLMDMALLNKSCICVPTPGQTEQEYIVKELFGRKQVYYESQKNFDLQNAINRSAAYKILHIDADEKEFIKTLEDYISS